MKATLFLKFKDNVIKPYNVNKNYNLEKTNLFVVKEDSKYRIGELYKIGDYDESFQEIYSPINLTFPDELLNEDVFLYRQKEVIIDGRKYSMQKEIIKDNFRLDDTISLAETILNYNITPSYGHLETYETGRVYYVLFSDFSDALDISIMHEFDRQTVWLSFDLCPNDNKNIKPYIIPDLLHNSRIGDVCEEHDLIPVIEDGKMKIGRAVKVTDFDRRHPNTLNRILLPYSLSKLEMYVNDDKPIIINSVRKFLETLAAVYNKDKEAKIVIVDRYHAKRRIYMHEEENNVLFIYRKVQRLES